MLQPEEQLSAVLSDESPLPVAPSDTGLTLVKEDVDDQVSVRQIGQGALFWRRFRRHKVAMVGAVLLGLIVIMAIIGPWITPESPLGYNPLYSNIPPQGNYRYLFGTDIGGHAVMMWVILGARTSLEVGVLAALLSTVIGVLLGAISGYFGGWVDSVMMRITDVFLTLPFLPLLLMLSKFFASGGVGFIVIIFGVLTWPGVARLIRSYYLTFREQEFVDAARAVGVSSQRIIFRHIMPNSLSPVIVSFTLSVALFIGLEAAVDFLGLGLTPPSVSWGLGIANAQSAFLTGNWWSTIFPGIALLLTVLAVNFLGDGLRDALDVKAKVVE
jgi:peptide/nickel transport system permease protein